MSFTIFMLVLILGIVSYIIASNIAERNLRNKAIKIIKLTTVILAFIVIIGNSFFIVNAGYRGVLLTYGKPSPIVRQEGINFKIPFVQNIVSIDTRTQKYEVDATSASKDLQDVNTKIAVNYHLVQNNVPILYKDIGIGYQDTVIAPAVQEVVKASTAEFTAEELITKRPEVKENIRILLTERLKLRNVVVEDISITNFQFSEAFNNAIEAKVTAEQLKLKADRDLERIKVEAQQKITSAQAEAEALRLQKQEITPDLLLLRQIEVNRVAVDKWDGHLPQVTGGAVPFINLNDLNYNNPDTTNLGG